VTRPDSEIPCPGAPSGATRVQITLISQSRPSPSMADDREPKHPLLHIYTDGAAGPTNPGPAASAWMIMDPASGEVLVEDAVFIGRQTNNVAEYTAICGE